MERKSMGSFIAALRKANGLTQKDLAEKLNVSDKSISRWEREDGSPDLSLIPIIAEIFSITSDELLCGERKSATIQAFPYSASPKAEKQRQRLLSVSLSRYRNMSFVAIGLAICGLIVALIGNLAFLRAYLGFFAGAVFFLATIVVQLICANAAFLTVSDSEQDDVNVGLFKYSVILLAEKVIGLSLVLFWATLPLIVFVNDAYLGLSVESFLQYGLCFGVFAFLLCCMVCYFLNHLMLKNGTYVLGEAREKVYHHNYRLKRRGVLVLVAVLAVTVVINGSLTAWGYSPSLAKGTVFVDFDSFKAYMELDIPYVHEYGETKAAPASDTSITHYDEYGNVTTEEKALTRTITDSDGNILCSFAHRNNTVWSWSYSTTQIYSITDLTNGTVAEALPITVYTHNQIVAAQQQAAFINAIFAAIYSLEVAAAFFIYYRKRVRF